MKVRIPIGDGQYEETEMTEEHYEKLRFIAETFGRHMGVEIIER